jgi:hypothetical protein
MDSEISILTTQGMIKECNAASSVYGVMGNEERTPYRLRKRTSSKISLQNSSNKISPSKSEMAIITEQQVDSKVIIAENEEDYICDL